MLAAHLITLAEWWLYIGAAVAVVFLTIGIDRIDEDALGAYVFRPLLIPGVMLIWPIVLWRWFVLETGRDDWAKRYRPDRKSHSRLWLVFGILIPLIVIGAMAVRQTWPAKVTPIRIDQPGEKRG